MTCFAVALRHFDLLNNAGVMRLPHDDHHVAAGFEHHLGFQPGAVHGFEVDHDGRVGKLPPEGAHGVQTLGQQQRRADLEPVDAGFDRGAGEVERFVRGR